MTTFVYNIGIETFIKETESVEKRIVHFSMDNTKSEMIIIQVVKRGCETLLKDMFLRGVLTGKEKTMAVWEMEHYFMDTNIKGHSSWCNLYNSVSRE